jgi:hypothetical protein
MKIDVLVGIAKKFMFNINQQSFVGIFFHEIQFNKYKKKKVGIEYLKYFDVTATRKFVINM